MDGTERIFVALDVPTMAQAKSLVEECRGSGVKWKVGKQLFTAAGPKVVEWIQGKGEQVFLDLKYFDIKETVVKASLAARELGVLMFNMHVQREETMREAVKMLHGFERRPSILGVTVLTDHDAQDIAANLGLDSHTFQLDVEQLVLHRARVAQECGLDGVVCSAKELRAIRATCGWDFLTVVPGTRSPGKDTHDQKRVRTPERAIIDGGDFLVCGRQITESSKPLEEVERIAEEIERGMRLRILRRWRFVKAVDFNLQDKWLLKVHDDYPEAPESPFYIDQRRLRSYPSLLQETTDLVIDLLEKTGERPALLSDIPTAITPLVTLVSQKTGIPMITPRLDAKAHGQQRQIDGAWQPGQTVVVIDDVRTAGGSKKKVVDLYRKVGLVPIRILVLVDRGEGEDTVDGVPLFAEYKWEEMLPTYREEGDISSQEYEASLAYPRELATYLEKAGNVA